MNRIKERMELGIKRYGHGVRVDDDTTEWGTKKNSWMEMADEELLDGLVYVTADYIRVHRHKDAKCSFASAFLLFENDDDDNALIMHILENWDHMEMCRHRKIIAGLFDMLL